jgi:hypothetical protein
MGSKRANIVHRDLKTDGAERSRRNLLAFLRSDRPAWQEKDHPELAAGSAAWVRKLRRESERRRP